MLSPEGEVVLLSTATCHAYLGWRSMVVPGGSWSRNLIVIKAVKY